MIRGWLERDRNVWRYNVKLFKTSAAEHLQLHAISKWRVRDIGTNSKVSD